MLATRWFVKKEVVGGRWSVVGEKQKLFAACF
jgi:hypothetical protein